MNKILVAAARHRITAPRDSTRIVGAVGNGCCPGALHIGAPPWSAQANDSHAPTCSDEAASTMPISIAASTSLG